MKVNFIDNNLNNKTIDIKFLEKDVPDDVLHQALIAKLSSKRQGNLSTKTRAEVSGGGRKPWRQKGTGRARVGSIRSPLWRGGGIIFGPKPRDFSLDLTKKMKQNAYIGIFNRFAKEKKLIVFEDFELNEIKTKNIKNNFKYIS